MIFAPSTKPKMIRYILGYSIDTSAKIVADGSTLTDFLRISAIEVVKCLSCFQHPKSSIKYFYWWIMFAFQSIFLLLWNALLIFLYEAISQRTSFVSVNWWYIVFQVLINPSHTAPHVLLNSRRTQFSKLCFSSSTLWDVLLLQLRFDCIWGWVKWVSVWSRKQSDEREEEEVALSYRVVQ